MNIKYVVEDWDTGDSEVFETKEEAIEFRYELEDSRMFPIVTCDCGNEIECRSFTNSCPCGADYNFNGSLLAPRSQWGEETGENWQDCY